MPYIGNTPTTQNFISGTDYFNGTGAQTAFTLTRTVNSVNDIQVVVNNVVQQPNDAYTLSGTTLTMTSAPSAGTNNVYVRYLSTTTQVITPSQNTVSWNTLDSNTQQDLGLMYKNKIINGAMQIDQRNAGAAVTTNSAYPVDRFILAFSSDGAVSVQQDSVAPSGFVNSIKWTTTTADGSLSAGQYNQVRQAIEGLNISDLAWGTANAKTITLSFWVRSSLTGTFAGSLRNHDGSRSYVFTYSIFSANTFEYKTITIAGDTSGTWLTTNGVGIYLTFDLGTGSTFQTTAGAWASGNYWSTSGAVPVISTLNATWYLTGVQLEVGTQATAFSTAGGSYGSELALCQRYFETYALNNSSLIGNSTGTTGGTTVLQFKVTKRATPTVTLPSAGQTTGTVTFLTASGSFPAGTGTHSAAGTTVDKTAIDGTGYSGLTSASASIFWSSGNSTIQISSEL